MKLQASSPAPAPVSPPGLGRRLGLLPLRLWRQTPWPGGRGRDLSKRFLLRHLDLDSENWFPTRVGWLRLRPGRDVLQRRLAVNGDHYETWVEAFLRSEDLVGATVFDIGAHVGYFSRLLAHVVGVEGRVVALEPQADLATLLMASTAIDKGAGSVTCLQKAVGRDAGRVSLHVAEDRGRTSLRPITDGSVEGVLGVERVRLDEVAGELGCIPRWVKMDVEGGELAALQGAPELLSRGDVYWLIEVHPSAIEAFGGDARQLVDLLASHGYRLHSLSRRGLQDLGSSLPGATTWHLVARP